VGRGHRRDPHAHERSARARAAYKTVYADAANARLVRGWLASEDVRDPLLRRQLVLLDNEYTGNQLPPETIEDLVRRATELEHTFTEFRATFAGERVTNNQLLDVLRDERDERRGARRGRRASRSARRWPSRSASW
jgi:hypothetical protein